MVRVAILSDLHCYSPGKANSRPSHISVSDINDRGPIASLRELISAESLQADILLCPGDIAYQADKASISATWAALNQLKREFGAELLGVATGNHEVDSRQTATVESDEPVEHLRLLAPPYPTGEGPDHRTSYFGSHVLYVERSGVRVLIFNSCNNHQVGKAEAYERGNFPQSSYEEIKRHLQGSDSSKPGILVCHHHPTLHSEWGLGSADVMRNGDQLLDLLEQYGSWLVVHGHKHHAKLRYAAGGSGSPVILSAGSFSLVLSQSGSGFSNQFYIVEIENDRDQLLGRVDAWTWTVTSGWTPSGATEAIPSGAGFGCRDSVTVTAAKISGALGEREFMAWDEVERAVPEIRFMIPSDVKKITNDLQRTHGIKTLLDSGDGRILQIGRSP